MFFQIKKKVKEGKVAKVEVECDDKIRNVRITGDFFMYPEEILEDIEKGLIGLERNENTGTIVSNIRKTTAGKDVRMIGISPESIALLIREALE